MIFAAILVYFTRARLIGSDGIVGFGILAAMELAVELAIFAFKT